MIVRPVLAIARQWQATIDQGLETGEAPILDSGLMSAPHDGAGPLLALAELAATRRDGTLPLLATGGVTPWWLVLLMRPPAASEQAPDPQIAFTATDPATHQAALATWDRRQSPYRERPGSLPIALQSSFTPAEHPAAAAPWESLPFALANAGPTPHDGWVAWAAVVVVLILIVLAILI